jgi:hypothetical protein
MKHKFTSFTALRLAPLAALNASRKWSEVPMFGKLRVGSFQALANCGALTSNAWN